MTDPEKALHKFCKKESYTWLCIHGCLRVSFGFVLKVHDDFMVFKDDELNRPFRVYINEIESMGVV